MYIFCFSGPIVIRKHEQFLDFVDILGIDTNDPGKSMLTFQYIATFATLIPFVDFSTASDHHKLTDEQHQIRKV